MKNKLGIIGGMGPLATSIFFSRIIDNTKASSDQEHIWTIISSHSTMPDRTKVIVEKLDKDVIIKAVSEDIRILETSGVSKIAIPCNTFHYFYDEVQALTSIPIINMVDETMKEFYKNHGNKALILSTTGTKKAGVYERYAKSYGIEVIEIDENYSNEINNLIYEIKETNNVHRPEFLELIRKLNEVYSPDGFVIACTELSLVPMDDLEDVNVIDAMDILVRESILQTGYELS